jgi:hypothetical protein
LYMLIKDSQVKISFFLKLKTHRRIVQKKYALYVNKRKVTLNIQTQV